MAAYSGDTSEESQAKIQELKVSLDEARTDLEETEWDKQLSDTSALLDSLYLEYETILNQRLDNVDALLSQVIDAVNAAASGESAVALALGEGGVIATILGGTLGENGTIKNTLTTEANNVGTKLSAEMKNIWTVGDGNIKSVLTTYTSGFNTKSTTVINTLNGIKVGVNNMVAALNKEAEKKTKANKTSSSSKKNPTKSNTSKKTTTTKKTTTKKSSGDGEPEIGDKVKYNGGRWYYDSYGENPSGYGTEGSTYYITHMNKSGTHPYHLSKGKKLGDRDRGWLKLSQISGYFTGKKKIANNEVAWTQEKGTEFIVRPSDGAILTPVAKNDSVLNAVASRNIWDMANNPADFIKENLGLGMSSVPNNSSVQNTITQNLDSVVFNFPNVHSYNEMLAQMQKDKSFEKLITAMTIDRINGGSSLAKNKVIR